MSLQEVGNVCTICNNTVMIPFRLRFEPGFPVHEQVTFAAKKAMVSGQLRPGDSFPSVRVISKALKINPNTAHKVITQLVSEGLLEVQPGLGFRFRALAVFPNQLEPTRHLILLQEMLSGLALKPKVFNGLYEIRKIFACLVIHLTKSR